MAFYALIKPLLFTLDAETAHRLVTRGVGGLNHVPGFLLAEKIASDTDGQFRRPSSLKVRPGRPGIDYVGPDVFFLIGDPEGTLCGIRLDSR